MLYITKQFYALDVSAARHTWLNTNSGIACDRFNAADAQTLIQRHLRISG